MDQGKKYCRYHGALDDDMVSKESHKSCKSGFTYRCKLCRLEKKISAVYRCDIHGFLSDGDFYNGGKCKKCIIERSGKNKKSRRSEINENNAKDRENNPEKWKQHYKKEYEVKKKKYGLLLSLHKVCQSRGITVDDYDRMLKEQNGRCQICRKEETCRDPKHDRIRRLNIDHCHITKKVRGLLCHNCNTAIGKLKDDLSLFEAAVNYLKKYRG